MAVLSHLGTVCEWGCRPDVAVITANPKTAGVARWNFLALWGHKQSQGDEAALDYCKKVAPHNYLITHNPKLFKLFTFGQA